MRNAAADNTHWKRVYKTDAAQTYTLVQPPGRCPWKGCAAIDVDLRWKHIHPDPPPQPVPV